MYLCFRLTLEYHLTAVNELVMLNMQHLLQIVCVHVLVMYLLVLECIVIKSVYYVCCCVFYL